MEAIETLMNEHRVIERAIEALAAFADQTRRGAAEDKQELARFVTFIREFADACHHGKEEDILFKAMVDSGFPSRGGPIAVMLQEHDIGRAYVKRLADLSAQAAPWSGEDREALAEAAHGYASLLRQHIHKEDAILYPMAEQRLPPDVQDRVDADCQRYEELKTGSGEPQRLLGPAEELLARHAPLQPREHAPQMAFRGGGCMG